MRKDNEITVLAFGGGIQSTAILLLIKEGIIEKPDFAVFADTGDEPDYVYNHIDKICKPLMDEIEVPFYIGNFENGLINRYLDNLHGIDNKYSCSIPFYVKNKKTGKIGMNPRQCTNNAKIRVVESQIRKVIGVKRLSSYKNKIRLAIGISSDEIERVCVNRNKYIINYYPLLMSDDMNNPIFLRDKISRDDCVEKCKEYGITPIKSSCFYCPYKKKSEWSFIKENHREEFDRACDVDDMLRSNIEKEDNYDRYIYYKCIPLREVNFITENEDHDNIECSGICGL